ncbi:MAG: BON domain-containing protein [Chloracidobacterium sp.]|nr:BON domain-containing protein [Chloracidobacterium sp.]
MKKTIVLTCALLLTVAFASIQTSLASQDDMMMKKKSDKSAQKSDSEIEKCIADKFAASKTVTNGAAKVTNGEATLTGEAKNGGAKGGATNQAKACGAKKVSNNMTTPKPATAKPSEKKATP